MIRLPKKIEETIKRELTQDYSAFLAGYTNMQEVTEELAFQVRTLV